ncbi:MAG TPA: pitrilysin family protein [Blastocatellia bacterium]|nr:pitrilysin family protein [Blastocatellia bacterium]
MNNAQRFTRGLLTIALAISSVTAYGQGKQKPAAPKDGAPAAAGSAPSKTINVNFKDVKLKNGLRVLLVEDHSAPVVSVAITFDVGSRNERKGRTGFAHLFEHLMFMGSENVGRNEYSLWIDTNGGANNATTSEDRTLYFATVPSNQLDMILFLESDRIRALDVTQEGLDIQRKAVQEERRLRVDNEPYGKTEEKFQEVMFDNFAYKHSVIGSMEDLNAASLQDVKEFFRIYYAPNNAALSLVGDFKSDEAMAKIKKYFESIPTQPAPPKVDTTEPEQTAERRFTMDDPFARLTQLLVGYKGVVSNTPDAYALQVLNSALSGGQSSRLYQKLVKEKELVTSVSAFPSPYRGGGSYQIVATVSPGKKVEDVETAINEEIERLQREPIADWELDKAKNSARRGSIQSLQSSLGTAIRLSEYAVFYDDPNLLNTQFQKFAAITKADVQRVAQKYLKQSNRTVAITTPAKQQAGAPGAAK